jgi:hypothetical protein
VTRGEERTRRTEKEKKKERRGGKKNLGAWPRAFLFSLNTVPRLPPPFLSLFGSHHSIHQAREKEQIFPRISSLRLGHRLEFDRRPALILLLCSRPGPCSSCALGTWTCAWRTHREGSPSETGRSTSRRTSRRWVHELYLLFPTSRFSGFLFSWFMRRS